MAEFIVVKVSSGAVPNLGQVGSADVYRGDHTDGLAARQAAAVVWRLGAGINLWSIPIGQFSPGTTSVTSS